MKVNGEAIYETRPWKVHGEGPMLAPPAPDAGKETDQPGPQDIRFTRNKAGTVVYAIVLARPEKEAVVRELGASGPHAPGRVEHVELLGYGGKVVFRQTAGALTVQLPLQKLSEYAIALKVRIA